MKRLISVVFLLIGTNLYGQECSQPNAKVEDVAEYLGKVAESLTHIKIQFRKLESLQKKKGKFDATDVFVALKELKAGYSCSASMIGAYKKSKTENIATSAETLSKSYQMLASGEDESIAEAKAFFDGKAPLSPGEKADRDSERMIFVKKKWELAILAIGVGCHAAVGKENPRTKKMDTLILSQSERDRIVKELRTVFTLSKKHGDRDPIDAAANLYYNFLNQPWNFK